MASSISLQLISKVIWLLFRSLIFPSRAPREAPHGYVCIHVAQALEISLIRLITFESCIHCKKFPLFLIFPFQVVLLFIYNSTWQAVLELQSLATIWESVRPWPHRISSYLYSGHTMPEWGEGTRRIHGPLIQEARQFTMAAERGVHHGAAMHLVIADRPNRLQFEELHPVQSSALNGPMLWKTSGQG